MRKGDDKFIYTGVLILLIFLFLGFIIFYLHLSYQNNLEFKRNFSCQDLNVNYYYNSKTGECEMKKLEEEKDAEISKYLCDFSVDYIKKERHHVDGLDLELIKNLEKKCQSSEDLLSNFACLNLEQEKDREYHKTYFNLEGILKTNGDEHLQLIGVKLYTMDAKQILLGQGVMKFNKDVKLGEETSFSITVLIDRNDENIARFFQKEDEVLISTSPVYSTCR